MYETYTLGFRKEPNKILHNRFGIRKCQNG